MFCMNIVALLLQDPWWGMIFEIMMKNVKTKQKMDEKIKRDFSTKYKRYFEGKIIVQG